MGCSYGNGYRITGDPAYRDVLIQSARSLATRFQPEAGVIMSWNPNKRWKCPVIIDNMMNLELLFNAAIYSSDSSFYKIAVSHADKRSKTTTVPTTALFTSSTTIRRREPCG